MPIYVSEIDAFMKQFDETHARTATQQKEVRKYRQLFQLRDEDTTQ